MGYKSCAWMSKDGKCLNHIRINKVGKRRDCQASCKGITCRELENKLNRKIKNRPMTSATELLIRESFEAGESIPEIAYTLNRKPKIVRKVLGMERGGFYCD